MSASFNPLSGSPQERVMDALLTLETLIAQPGVLEELADLITRAAQRSAPLSASPEAASQEASSASSSSSSSSSREYGPVRNGENFIIEAEEPTLFHRPRLESRIDSHYPVNIDSRVAELLLKNNYLMFEKRRYKVSEATKDSLGQYKVILKREAERRTSVLEKNLTDCTPTGFFTTSRSINPVRNYPYALLQATTLARGSYLLVKNISYKRSDSSWFVSANVVSLTLSNGEPIGLETQPEKIRIYPQHHQILGLIRIPRKTDAKALALIKRIFSILPNCLDRESIKISGRSISILRLKP